MINIKGQVKYIIFESDTGYKVGQFYIKNIDDEEYEFLKNKNISFTGYFSNLYKEDTYTFSGEYIYHEKYGYQFQVQDYKKELPVGKDAVIEFLSSSFIKGCGEKTATKIVEVLGEDAINIIKEDPSKLLLIDKMSEKKAVSIYNSLLKYAQEDELIVELKTMGFTIKETMSIIEEYKDRVRTIIDENIYELTAIIDFKKIDRIYLEKNSKDEDIRINACLIESIKRLEFLNGDTYHYKEDIILYLNKEFNIKLSDITDYLNELKNNKKIIVVEDKIFLAETFLMEKDIANNLYLIATSPVKKIKLLDEKIKTMEEEFSVKYNTEQKNAIKTALNNNVTIITGGPGTGKTTIINAIVKLYVSCNNLNSMDILNHIALLAPTGRASKRLSESTNLPAMTIHRYLKWNKESNTFSINEDNKNYQRLIIVDETSMIDTNLFAALLKGLYSNIKLIIVGDENQLPSVGAGLILNDLINSKIFNHVSLSKIYRQSDNSYIPDLAKEIKEYKLSDDFMSQKDDYNFLNVDNNLIKNTIQKICMMSKDKGLDEKSIQILAPMYKGENGIDNLNYMLQNLFNPKDKKKKEIKVGDVIYREKDKVIQLLNDPDNNVFNGDIGYVYNIKKDGHNKDVVTIDFDGNYIEYYKDDMLNLKHAYAMTIHKAQGSEFNHIIMPISSSYKKMLYNKLIYTGVSRAKKSLVIIGSPVSFKEATLNSYSTTRKTMLCDLIVNNFN